MQTEKQMNTDEFVQKCTSVFYALKQVISHVNIGHDRDHTFFRYIIHTGEVITIYNSPTKGVIWGHNYDLMTKTEKFMGKAVEVEQ